MSQCRRQMIRLAAKLPAGSPERRELLETLVQSSTGPQQTREAASLSWMGRKRMKFLTSMEEDLRRVASKYLGSPAEVRVKTGRGLKSGFGVNFSLWLPLEEGDGREEAQELSNIILGPKSAVGQHKLVPNMWVANLTVDLY